MKSEIQYIVGKTITSVIVSDSNQIGPNSAVLLVFSDDTYYELYGTIHATGKPSTGGETQALEYARGFKGRINHYKQEP